MIEQQAVIVANEAGYVWVIPDQMAGCKTCTTKSVSCTKLSLSHWLRPREPQPFKVLNPVYAKIGEHVVVGIKSDAFLFYALLAYLLPLLGMLMSAVLGMQVFEYFKLNMDIGAALAGVAGLLVGFRVARRVSYWSHQLEQFRPVILRKQRPIDSVQLSVVNFK